MRDGQRGVSEDSCQDSAMTTLNGLECPSRPCALSPNRARTRAALAKWRHPTRLPDWPGNAAIDKARGAGGAGKGGQAKSACHGRSNRSRGVDRGNAGQGCARGQCDHPDRVLGMEWARLLDAMGGYALGGFKKSRRMLFFGPVATTTERRVCSIRMLVVSTGLHEQ